MIIANKQLIKKSVVRFVYTIILPIIMEITLRWHYLYTLSRKCGWFIDWSMNHSHVYLLSSNAQISRYATYSTDIRIYYQKFRLGVKGRPIVFDGFHVLYLYYGYTSASHISYFHQQLSVLCISQPIGGMIYLRHCYTYDVQNNVVDNEIYGLNVIYIIVQYKWIRRYYGNENFRFVP